MSKMDVTKLRDIAIEYHGLMNMDKKYKFYYDETYNPRKFIFKKDKGEFNSDIDENFILGGVVLASEIKILPEFLLKELKLEKNAKEFKYRHIIEKCKGDFFDNLKSKRLNSLLKWIDKNNIFIHFSSFNNLYWGIVDIIDSIDDIPIEYYNAMKNVLYKYFKRDIDFIYKISEEFNYPNIEKSEIIDFCSTIIEWCENVNCDNIEDEFLIEMLRQGIKQSKRKNELTFLEENENLLFVKDYSNLYMHKTYMLINSEHVFDRETEVEKIIDGVEIIYKNKKLTNFRFEDSVNEFYIQVSDVIVGLLGRLFLFLNKHSIKEIDTRVSELDVIQLENIKLFGKLINKSLEENRVFLHHTASIDEVNKFENFLDFISNI